MANEKKRAALETRLEAYRRFSGLFASAPIRLMSRVVSAMQSQGFADQATAIGDMDWRTVPVDDPEDPTLRDDWGCLLERSLVEMPTWLAQLGTNPMGYNLDSVGYPLLIDAWSALWRHQVGLEMGNVTGKTPEIFVFHGGNQALQAALLGVAEAHRDREGSAKPPTILVPIPTFSCPLDQMALQGMRTWLLPPSQPHMDPDSADLDSIPEGTEIDGLYLMPVTNPTGRTLQPARLRQFLGAFLDRWPHAGIILDSVYVRLHPEHATLLEWYREDPRFAERVIFVDSLSKTCGVTGLRAGVVLTKAADFAGGITRYAQNIMAGPSNLMQAMSLALLAPYVTGNEDLQAQRLELQLRIGRHLRRRRRLIVGLAFEHFGPLLDTEQPVLPDPVGFDWEGSMYAVLRLSEGCLKTAAQYDVSPTVAFFLETGFGGVPLTGFCVNANLARHGLVVNGDDEALAAFQAESQRYVRLSFGLTPPPVSRE